MIYYNIIISCRFLFFKFSNQYVVNSGDSNFNKVERLENLTKLWGKPTRSRTYHVCSRVVLVLSVESNSISMNLILNRFLTRYETIVSCVRVHVRSSTIESSWDPNCISKHANCDCSTLICVNIMQRRHWQYVYTMINFRIEFLLKSQVKKIALQMGNMILPTRTCISYSGC